MNYPELRAAIARSGKTNRSLAKELGLSEQCFYNKMQGETEFKGSEIKKLARCLGLSMKGVDEIFFDGIVNQIHETPTANHGERK